MLGGEMIVVSLITTLGMIFSLVLLQRNKERMLELNKKYQIEILKLKKREGRKDKKLVAELNPEPPTSLIDSVKGIDLGKVKGLLDMVQGKDYDIDEEPRNDLIGMIGDFAESNPEMVKGFIDGLGKKEEKGKNDIVFE